MRGRKAASSAPPSDGASLNIRDEALLALLRSPRKRISKGPSCGRGKGNNRVSQILQIIMLLTIACNYISAFDSGNSLMRGCGRGTMSGHERYSITQLAFADSTPGSEINDSPFEDSGSSSILTKSKNIELRKIAPPWLPASESSNTRSTSARNISKAYAKYNLHLLQQALEKHVKLTGSKLFTTDDAAVVVEAVFAASKGKDGNEDYRLLGGAADFLVLLLSVEEYNTNEDDVSLERYGHDIVNGDYYTVMTRDALVASAFHYCDCVLAREAGIYDIIDNLMRITNVNSGFDAARFLPESTENAHPLLSSAIEGGGVTVDVDIDGGGKDGSKPARAKVLDTNDLTDHIHFDDFDEETNNHVIDDSEASTVRESIKQYGEGAVRISQSAARIKRAEIMSHSVLPKKITTVTPSRSDAASLRGLLLSVADDWRSLVIRSSACLYRLRGIVQHDRKSLALFGLNDYEDDYEVHSYNNMQIVREAREALTVYAPLAERLGMHRLKSELENAAFRVLYKRQYNVVQSIYSKSGATIQSITDYLTRSIEEILNDDLLLSSQLERLTVASRVKKPYSLWRKLLKLRAKSEKDPALVLSETNEPTITLVPDAIAMRVILKAKKNDPIEDEKGVRSREEFLCYYIQNLLMTIWPAVGSDRVKDYIRTPKPNGYQSLHYTASIFRYGSEWPFEVQIRSEDMHTKSEYGAAAHWDYKLKSGVTDEPLSNVEGISSVTDTVLKSSPFLLKGTDNTIESKNRVCEGNEALHVEGVNSRDDKTSLDADSGVGPLQRLTRASTLEAYIDALFAAREHLVGNSVFVFFLTSSESKGKVIGLPSGSTVADALKEFYSRYDVDPPISIGDSDISVFLNGAEVSFHEIVKNGDTLVVPSITGTEGKEFFQ